MAHTFYAVRVGDVAVNGGSADDFHDVDGGPGEGHAVATQPLAEGLGLASQFLQLVLVLQGHKHEFFKCDIPNNHILYFSRRISSFSLLETIPE